MGTVWPSGLSSQMCNTGQIWTHLECAMRFTNDIFPLLGFQKPRVQSFTMTFLCRSELTTTLLEKDLSQCVWLYVSLLCFLEKKDCRGSGKQTEKSISLASFPWGVLTLKKKIALNQVIYIRHFQILNKNKVHHTLANQAFVFLIIQIDKLSHWAVR